MAGATEEEERQHLYKGETRALASERLMEVERDEEAERRELEQQQQAPDTAQQEKALAAYQQVFPWVQAPEYVHLTNEDDDDA